MLVYLLTNEVNGKYYVGKTSNPNLNDYLSVKRWAARHGKMMCMPLIRAMRKHGPENFTPQVLTQAIDYAQLDLLERLWIIALDARNPNIGYNLTAGGEGVRMPCSEEKKLKIGLANKGRKPKGYTRTEEHRQQLRTRMLGTQIGVGHGRPKDSLRSAEEKEKHRQNALRQWQDPLKRPDKNRRVAIF